MGTTSSARRAGAHSIRGRRRAQALATRLGVALREARETQGITQSEAADRVGISQPRWSELERGLGHHAPLVTWTAAASSVGEQLAAFLEFVPGADRPRDFEHLRRQNALIELARTGSWTPLPELAVDPTARNSRSIDVALVRAATNEAVVAEIWDWFEDFGAGLRNLDAKTNALRGRLGAEWSVSGLYVVRDTSRNRALVRELAALVEARFPASPRAWLLALREPSAPMPERPGLLWSARNGRLRAANPPHRR